jgi:transketolase
VPKAEFDRVVDADMDVPVRLALIADMARLNALSAVKMAGSGHLGASFSSLDVVVHLYFSEMNLLDVGVDSPDRDIYLSSKGHDCPGYYAALEAAGILDSGSIFALRRLGGLDGHPDVHIAGVEANSGSLGMGISKGKGVALAKRLTGHGGRVFVMTGDGELQEGQIWESAQVAVQQRVDNLFVIVDYNKIQTDKAIDEIVDLGGLEEKFRAFGWHMERCDGHDHEALSAAFARMTAVQGRPKILLADTIKGKGVSFMEGPKALRDGEGLYPWHSGAPADGVYVTASDELVAAIDARLAAHSLAPVDLVTAQSRETGRIRLKDTAEKCVTAYGDALVAVGDRRRDLVVLDADLAADCGLRPFEHRFPERFVECGIAEQDMVSTAGGLALQGLLPVCNSFGVFLASRSNEQIYNNATERTKIIYVCHYAGLIPAGPGKSHQSLRDVSLLGALPNMVILEPCNALETTKVLDWCVDDAVDNCMLRLVISPSPRTIELPPDYRLEFGRGTVLRDGVDAIVLAYGPVMLHEALKASEILAERGFGLKVVDMPWLNRVDAAWLDGVLAGFDTVFVIDDHAPYGALGEAVLGRVNDSDSLRGTPVVKLGVDGYPACGTPQEALAAHALDAASIAARIEGP